MRCSSKMRYQSMITIVFLTITSMVQATNKTLPVKYSAKIIPESDTICPSTRIQEMTFAEIDQEISTLIRNTVLTTFGIKCPGFNPENPATSCLKIAECDPSLPSGYYWINTTTQVYCDMDREGCNGTGGWTRVAYLNMTDPADECPSAWTETTSPIRTCGRRTVRGCDSATFSTNGIEYSNIVGRVVAYQFGSPDTFSSGRDIESNYLDGVSITHGMPRSHIWSFASELRDNYRCPCSTTNTAPSFVGEDYFCEAGTVTYRGYVFYPDDPLWDGQ